MVSSGHQDCSVVGVVGGSHEQSFSVSPYRRSQKGEAPVAHWRLEPAAQWLTSLQFVVVTETAAHPEW